jgi:hypothetical protein
MTEESLEKVYGPVFIRSQDKEVPSITMGDGSVALTVSEVDDYGFVNVVMSASKEDTKAGDAITREEGVGIMDLDPYMLLRFDNPKSIDVVIAHLHRAKLVLAGKMLDDAGIDGLTEPNKALALWLTANGNYSLLLKALECIKDGQAKDLMDMMDILDSGLYNTYCEGL